MVKEFDPDGTCTIKLAGVIGKTLGNYSIISIVASEALSDVLTFWTDENLNNFTKGDQIPKKLFRNEAKAKGTDNKPWVPSLHPVTLFRVPVCIPKLRGYQVETGLVTKPSVRLSLQKYTRLAVDWLDVTNSHRVGTKYATHDMFNVKYLPNYTNKKYILQQVSLKPTFEMTCDWVKKTNNVEFRTFVNESDCNVKYSPFNQASSTYKGTGSTSAPEGTTLPSSATAQSNGSAMGPVVIPQLIK